MKDHCGLIIVIRKNVKTESTRSSDNKWTKTLYKDHLHCIENFCGALFNIF